MLPTIHLALSAVWTNQLSLDLLASAVLLRSSTSVISVSYQSNCVTNLLTVFAVAEEEEIANCRALEAERVERCQRHRQHEEEETEDCTPEHVNQDEDELDHDDKDDTIVHVN